MSKNADPFALFQAMQHRLDSKRPKQWDLQNVLPPLDVDFDPYFKSIIPEKLENKPKGTRRDIAVQKELLRWNRKGQPEITALHMLLISYLRRESNHTDQARQLFLRLWDEKAVQLLEILPLREQVSALRTFADHAPDTLRRLSAKMGFIYVSLINVYESERIAEGLSPKLGDYKLPVARQNSPIGKLRAARFGRDDSVEIINLMLAEEVLNDPLIGTLLLNIMEAVYSGDSLFSRVDDARHRSEFDTDSTTFWSFGFDPAKTSLEEFAEMDDEFA